MSKVKKSRKSTQEGNMDDDVSMDSGEDEQPKVKSAKKNANQAKSKTKGKPQKSVSRNSDGDSESDEDEQEFVPLGRGKKMQSVFAMLGDEGDDVGSGKDSDDSEMESKPAPKKKTTKESNRDKKAQKKSSFDDENEDDDVAAETIVKPDKKSAKKSKKDKKKKGGEDIEQLLAEIETGKKEVDEEAKGDTSKEVEKSSKKKKKKKEEFKSDALLEDDLEKLVLEDSVVETVAVENDESKPASAEKTVEDKAQSGNESGQDDGDVTVKSAAQKRKEKREREKLKKKAEKSKQKTKGKDEPEVKPEEEPPADIADDDDDDATGGDKKKKKGAKDKDKDKKKSKPGNKQIELIREAQRKIEEEKERLRREEEEKIKREEEAEERREEEKRLEQERREKKKQEEKERKERLKAEGKFQTKAQKEKSARILAHFRAQGFVLPDVGESPNQTSKTNQVPKKTKKDKKVNNEQKSEDSSEVTAEPQTPTTEEKPEGTKDSWEQESEGEGVKDSWDISSEEEEDDSKIETNNKKTPASKTKPKKSASSSEESDSDDSEEDSDDETSESDSEPEQKYSAEKLRERALLRIQKRREDNEAKRSMDNLRSPVVCVLGHVDTGKTKILDKIRHTHVQDQEAGGITQQIGATFVPVDAIKEQAKMVKQFDIQIKIPGLLIIDTPGHESFSNLRSRGSSLCDMAILVVDIMHGLEPQTIESINLLKNKKTPFVVALNKVDRLYDWKSNKNKDIRDLIKSQGKNTQLEFEERVKETVVQFAEQGLNATLFYDNQDLRSYVSLVPTSAATADGMGNLIALVTELTQSMLTKRLMFSDELQATVLEVKLLAGLGTTVDLILINGKLREGDTIILAGTDGPLVTQVRSLLMPQPLKELRVKNAYQEFKEICGAQGVKITGKELDKAIAGLNLLVAYHADEVEICKDEVAKELHQAMNSIKLVERGVFVQASTLGSLEALIEFLKQSNIPYAGIRIGPVVKKDVMKASIMLEHDKQYAVILAFDVKVERDAQDLAESLGVRIFCADIIYHLFDKFMAYRDELKAKKRDEFKHVAVFPCKLRILPQFIFNSRDPIIIGVSVEAGVLKTGTPICVPSKEFLDIGTVTTIEMNHKAMETARKGQEVCIKIEPLSGESPKMYGRHFEPTDMLVSKVTRQSIDACKDYFRDDLQKTDWQLMVELKKLFQIL